MVSIRKLTKTRSAEKIENRKSVEVTTDIENETRLWIDETLEDINNIDLEQPEIKALLETDHFSIKNLKNRIDEWKFFKVIVEMLKDRVKQLKELWVTDNEIDVSEQYLKDSEIIALLEVDDLSIKAIKNRIDEWKFFTVTVEILKDRIKRLRELWVSNEMIDVSDKYLTDARNNANK